MGMVVVLNAVSDANIARLLQDPPLVWKIVAPEDPELYEAARKETRGLLARLFSRTVPPLELVDEGGEISTELDKSWHAIHYLLTGHANEVDGPLGFLVGGGTEIGNIEVGYGPARAFTAAETRAIHEALSPIDDGTLKSRFDFADMTKKDVYPSMWDRPDERDDHIEYVMDYAASLRVFLRDAVARGRGMVISVT